LVRLPDFGPDVEESQLPLHGSEPRSSGILQDETVIAAEPVRPGSRDDFHAANDAADFEIHALWEILDAPLATDGQEVFVLGSWSRHWNSHESRCDLTAGLRHDRFSMSL